jgi:hypothetical protein
MLRRLRPRLSYANVIATLALFIALGGGAYAAVTAPKNSVTSRSIRNGQVKRVDLAARAVTNSRIGPNAVSNSKVGPNAVSTGKIADNAVTTTKVLDGAITTSKVLDAAITTPKLADNSVTQSKLSTNSVNGLTNIEDGTVTGADVLENTLKFGCSATTVQSPNSGPFQIGTDGACAFVMHPSGTRTWSQAATDCNGVVGDSTLANPAQIEQLGATNGGAQSPVAGTSGIWTPNPAAANNIWTVTVDGNGHVSLFTSSAMGTPSSGPIVCVYQPASKNG